ncbi:MAG: glycosyltransferase family 39 protein [Melioribacteraceae bacterium]
MQKKNIYRNFLWLLIIVGEIIHFVVPFIHNPIDAIWSDPGRWWEYATTMGIDTYPVGLMDPIFYQAWLSFVAKFTLDIPILTGLYAGLLSAITPWFWYRFLRELLPNKQEALLGWAILALLPSWIGIYSYFMTETLLLTLMGFSLWASWRSLRKKDFNSFIFAWFIWTFATLTRSIVGPIAAVIMLFVWWQQKQKVKSMTSIIILTSIVLIGLSYRSYERSGMFIPLGHAYLNSTVARSGSDGIRVSYYGEDDDLEIVYIFQSATVDSPVLIPFSNWTSSRSGIYDAHIHLDNQYEDWQNHLQKIADNHKISYSRLIYENLILLLFGPSWPDMNEEFFFEQINTWSRFMWFPLFGLSFIFLIHGMVKKQFRNNLPLFSALIVWFILQGIWLVSVNEGRYRKPVEGIIIASVLLGISQREKKKVK